LGGHAQQQGSKVDEDWLRFDFTNLAPVSPDQLDAVEQTVTRQVEARQPIRWETMPLAEARAAGAMMLFGEKYPDPVRMVSMGDFSKELCGGTHLDNTRDVGAFEILTEEGVAAGTRRVVAVTGTKAREHSLQTERTLQQAASVLEVAPSHVAEAAKQLVHRVRDLKKQLAGGGKAKPEASVTRERVDGNLEVYAQQRAALRETARMLNVAIFDTAQRLEAMRDECRGLEEQLAERERAGGVSAANLLQQAEDVNGTKVIVAELPAAGAISCGSSSIRCAKLLRPVPSCWPRAKGTTKSRWWPA
jgi:alanyl-tRNA synthetase